MLEMQMHLVMKEGRKVMAGIGPRRTLRQDGAAHLNGKMVDVLRVPRRVVNERGGECGGHCSHQRGRERDNMGLHCRDLPCRSV